MRMRHHFKIVESTSQGCLLYKLEKDGEVIQLVLKAYTCKMGRAGEQMIQNPDESLYLCQPSQSSRQTKSNDKKMA